MKVPEKIIENGPKLMNMKGGTFSDALKQKEFLPPLLQNPPGRKELGKEWNSIQFTKEIIENGPKLMKLKGVAYIWRSEARGNTSGNSRTSPMSKISEKYFFHIFDFFWIFFVSGYFSDICYLLKWR